MLTLGSEGLWTCAHRELQFHPVEPLDVVDSTGAGDFFAGGFLAAYLRALPLKSCVAWGSQAACQVLQTFGTDLKEGVEAGGRPFNLGFRPVDLVVAPCGR